MNRNGWLVLVAKSVRTFCYGFLGVLFPVYLTQLGMDARGLGLAVTLTLLGSAALTYAAKRPAERYGSRAVLIVLSSFICLSAVLFLRCRHAWIVVFAAMVGNLAVGTGETGPFLALEQVLLTRGTSRQRLTGAMSFYNLVGYVLAALGAVIVGKEGVAPAHLFLLFLVSGCVQIGAYALLQDSRPDLSASSHAVGRPSELLIWKLAALFSLDAFAGGFVLQSFIVFWLYTHFHMRLATLGTIAFGTQLCSGASFLLAIRLARRAGLVNTMVFTHLISNVLLILLAFVPSAGLAAGCLLLRHLFSQMDVPTRQTFLMLAVKDYERERAATLTTMSRTFAQAVSPAITGWVMRLFSLSAPFVIGGGLKILYDLAVYRAIRHVPLHDEASSASGFRSP